MLLFSGCIVFPLFLFPPLSFCFCELVLFMVAYFSDSLLFIFSEAVMGFCFVVFKAYIKLLIFFLKIYLLTFGCALLLHRLFSSFREWGPHSSCSLQASHSFLREQENLTLGLLITSEVYIRVAQVTCHWVM